MAALVATLDFRLERLELFLIYKLPQCFLPCLETGFWVKEKMQKIDFQDGHHGHLGFPIGMNLAIFDLQVTPMLPRKFGVNWPFGSEAKNRFSRWRPSWISDRHDFSYFDLQVTPILPSKFGVNWPFGSGEETKNRFSTWRPSWISDRRDFSYF